jgi:small subunit ribosomal protein S6
MRIYEELFIVRPDATEEEVEPVIDLVKNVVTAAGGTVDKTEKWGVRKLAYRVKKQAEGQYVLVQFTAAADTVKELERKLRVSDLVIKFLTVRIDEKLKRIEKRKKAREKRALRKPPPPPAAPSTGFPAFAQEPGPVPGAPAPGAPAPAAPAAAEAES